MSLIKKTISVVALSTLACATTTEYAPSSINGKIESYLIINDREIPVNKINFNYNQTDCNVCAIEKEVSFRDPYNAEVKTKQNLFARVCKEKELVTNIFSGEPLYSNDSTNNIKYTIETLLLPGGGAVQLRLDDENAKARILDEMPEDPCPAKK